MVEAAPLEALRGLRSLLDQDLAAAKSADAAGSVFDTSRSLDSADEPENEIPRSNYCSPEELSGENQKDRSRDEMKALLLQLSEQQCNEEMREVISTVQAAVALADLQRRPPLRPSLDKVGAQAFGARSAGSESEQLAESLQARLMSTRKALKDREWALAEARHRQQQMEDDRLRQDCRVRALETALDRATSRGKADRSAADEDVAYQLEDLRSKLSTSEAARQKAETALEASDRRAEEALRREQELQRQLEESARELEELREQLRRSQEKASPPEPAQLAAAPNVDLSALRIQGMPSGGILEEGYLEGVGMVIATPRQHHQSREEPPVGPRGTPPKPEGRRMSAPEQPTKRAAAHPMPMNLRSLGKLLSGGGVLGK